MYEIAIALQYTNVYYNIPKCSTHVQSKTINYFNLFVSNELKVLHVHVKLGENSKYLKGINFRSEAKNWTKDY